MSKEVYTAEMEMRAAMQVTTVSMDGSFVKKKKEYNNERTGISNFVSTVLLPE